MKLRFLAVAAFIGVAVTQSASAGHVYAEANGARVGDRWGGELGVGYAIGIAGFNLSAGGGAFLYKGDNDRYYEDPNGGNQRCRDSSNGQYVKSSDCNNLAAKAYGRIEATYHIPLFATVGAGARIGSKVRPYGTISLPIGPVLTLKGNGGPHYGAIGLRAGF